MKKIISLFLTVAILVLSLSAFPLTASADYYSTAFIGDSICKMGQWNEYFERDDIDNYGKGGYTSARVFEVFQEVEKTYDQIFIICGINDKKIKDWSYDISLANYKSIIDYAIEKNPNCKIYSVSLLPTSGEYANFVDEGFQAGYNERLKALADEYSNVTFINCYDALADENGYYKADYTEDGLHPEYVGFIEMAKVLEPYANAQKGNIDNPIILKQGDINADGVIDIVDVAIVRAHIIGNIKLSDTEILATDMNGDGVLDIIDVVMMRNIIINGAGSSSDTDSEVVTEPEIDSEIDSEVVTESEIDSEIVTEHETDVETDSENTIPVKATYKYDLENGKLSNFDISFLKAENNKSNKVYSPLSIKYALKMLQEGANGDSKAQINDVLEDYVVTKYNSNENMSLANAFFMENTVSGYIKPSFISTLQSKYDAEVKLDSFKNPDNINNWIKEKTLGIIPILYDELPPANLILINALGIDMKWKNPFLSGRSGVSYSHVKYGVYCNTGYLSSRLFGDDKLKVSGMEIFASMDNYDIVNVLGEENIRKTVGDAYRQYISKTGKSAYYKPLTTQEEIDAEVESYLDSYIYALNNNRTMYGETSSTDFSLYTDDDVKVFAKDLKEYDGTTLQYIAVMPTSEDLDKYVESVDANKLNDLIGSLKELKKDNFKDGVITKIKGFIPEFNFEYELQLKDDLKAIGITDVFDAGKADLTGITDLKPTYVSDARHKAKIEFSYEGIKAAAVTAFGIDAGAAMQPDFNYEYDVPVEEIDLTFDKPYMFIIRDKDTGDVWFSGTVYEPNAYTEPVLY